MIKRVATRLGLAVAMSIVLLGNAQAQPEIAQAENAFQQQQFDKTLSDLEPILKKDPNNAKALFLQGGALAKLGRLGDAEKAYRHLTQAHPDIPQGWNNLGLLLAHQGKLDEAQTLLEKATHVDKKYAAAHESLGDVYLALAQSEYVAAANLQPKNSDNSAELKSQRLMSLLKSSGASVGRKTSKTLPSQSSTSHSSTPPAAVKPGAAATQKPTATVYAWADAWASQDVERYLNMYAAQFRPDSADESRAAWAAERSERLRAPSHITVQISDLHVTQRGDKARVTFSQRYRSDSYQDVEHKALMLTATEKGWRILREGEASDIDWDSLAD